MTDIQDQNKDLQADEQEQVQTPIDHEQELAILCEEYLAGWKRSQADYANLKKETDKAKAEFAIYANEKLLYELLPAVELFETAMEHIPDLADLPEPQKTKLQNWMLGIKAVRQQWEQTFNDMGLQNVDTTGVFDPSKHNAVGKEDDKEKPEHSIIRVVQSGWILNGKVLRPAKVIVNQSTENE